MLGWHCPTPRCQTHEIFLGIRPVINYFGSCVTVGCKEHLILHCLEKLLSNRCTRVVVDTQGIYFKHLTVKHLLRTAYISDSREQLIKVISLSGIFQQVVIQRKPLDHIFLQHLSCPLPELYAPMRIDAITDTDNHIEVIDWNLTFHLTPALCLNLCKKCTS